MKVSVIISNRNDLEMLAITVRSCIEELVDIPNSDIIICDNSDDERWKLLSSVIPQQYCRDKKIRIIRQSQPCLFTARETAIKASSAEYIFCVDSHMLIGHNCIRDLVYFMDSKKCPKIGFAHAPINWCHQHESRSRHDRNLSQSELGPWGTQYKIARKITWKGMPWICRRDWFLNDLNSYGALSQHQISWGGGDMHIGTKPWLLGYQNWAVPTRPCIHIGPFPKEVSDITGNKYRVYANSGNGAHAFGFLVSCYVLGGEPMMERNAPFLKEKFGLDINVHRQKAINYGQDERSWMLKNQVMNYENFIKSKPWNN